MISQQYWYEYLFQVLFVLAFLGFYLGKEAKNGYRMVYAFMLMIVWSTLVYINWIN